MKINTAFKVVFTLLSISTVAVSCAQTSTSNHVVVGFYNVENLFDTLDIPEKNDEEFTPAGDRNWGSERYENKLNNLAKVIGSMNNGNAPDILGLCEIENKQVVDDLVATKALKEHNYKVVHRESKDWRGIDVALIYKEGVFTENKVITYLVPMPEDMSPTRDVFIVQGSINNKPISFFVNHFPSRSGGQEESEPRRISAAKTLRHAFDSIKKVNPKENILMMGDFNDEPADSSIGHYIGGCNYENMDKPCAILNLMYPLKEKGEGSYKYRDDWNMLDQILVSSNLFSGENGLDADEKSAAIYAEDWMKQTTPKYFGSPLRTFGGRKYLAGYSDHFPVYVKIELK